MPTAHGLEGDEQTAIAMGIFYVTSSSFQVNACSPRQEFYRLESCPLKAALCNRVELAVPSSASGPGTHKVAHHNPQPLCHG